MDDELATAVEALRAMIVAGDQYRLQAAAYFGLGLSDTHALSHLHARGALSQGDLARLVGVSTSGATVLIDRLENAGVAERRTDPDDRRRVQVVLTQAGLDTMTVSSERLQHAFAHVEPRQLRAVAEQLTTIAHDLTDQAAVLRDGGARRAPISPTQRARRIQPI